MFKVVKKRFLNEAKTICLFEIEAPLVAKHAQAGQFVIFRLDEQGERTPVSVAGYDREKGTVTRVTDGVPVELPPADLNPVQLERFTPPSNPV